MPIKSMSVHVDDRDYGMADLMSRLTNKASHVDIGVHALSGQEIVTIASANEFGATINHPGGQPYFIVDPLALLSAGKFRKQKDGTLNFKQKYFTHKGNLNRAGHAISKAAQLLPDGRMIVFKRKGSHGPQTKPHKIVIPERSFIRAAVDGSQSLIESRAQAVWDKVVLGEITKARGLALMGELIQTLIQRRIRSNVPPPNAMATIMRKGSSKTLIDTGALLSSIRYVVKDNSDQAMAIQSTSPGGRSRNR